MTVPSGIGGRYRVLRFRFQPQTCQMFLRRRAALFALRVVPVRARKAFVIPRTSLPFGRADRRTTSAWTPGWERS